MGRAAEADRLRLTRSHPPVQQRERMSCLRMSTHCPQTRELHGISFTLLEPLNPDRAHFTFTGSFQGVTILWNATLRPADRAAAPAAGTASSIDIGEMTAAGRTLTVTLDIPAVDEPAILRTIIMIRQYKRLHPGRHEFGGKTAT